MGLNASWEATQAERTDRTDCTAPVDAWEIVMFRARRLYGQRMAVRDRQWPGKVRRMACQRLSRWQLDKGDVDAVGVLLSELVTNAFAYGDGPTVGVQVTLAYESLLINVHDGSPTVPKTRVAELDDESGRGLLIVHYLVAERSGDLSVSDDGMSISCRIPLGTPPCLR
ncbi:ATP-binding protein [Streptomyces sp. NPDC056672]|uniref:ATP-binding protein n=1 Tax=Streptomyces sp. NPDC056672 TaxID=3345906 RepID=UPI0036B79C8E